jgi:hypothetical protein
MRHAEKLQQEQEGLVSTPLSPRDFPSRLDT